MGDKIRENGDNAGVIEKSMDGNMHAFEKDPFYENKIEYPFELFNPIPLDDDDFLDGLYYEESEYYDFDEYGFDDDY